MRFFPEDLDRLRAEARKRRLEADRRAELVKRGPKTYAEHGTFGYDVLTALGCLEDGEPTFLLRAQDRSAANTVRDWATRNVDNPEMVEQALAIAKAMDDWPVKKMAD